MRKSLFFGLAVISVCVLISGCVHQQQRPKAEETVYYIDGKPATLNEVAAWQQQSAKATLQVDTEAEPLNRDALEKAIKKNDNQAPKTTTKTKPQQTNTSTPNSGPMNLVKVPNLARKKKPKKPSAKETILAARVRGELNPTGQNFSGATLVNNYHEDKVDIVYTSPFGLTEIILQEGEIVTDTLMMDGDPLNWKIDDNKGFGTLNGLIKPVIGIKPTLSGLENHISILTDRRRYRLRVISQEDTYMPAIRWEYPEDKLKALREKQRLQRISAEKKNRTVMNVGKDFNFGYKVEVIEGKTPPWKPTNAFDNGTKTYIVFPNDISNYETPALFSRNERGDITILPYRPKGNLWEIDHVIQQAELRFGSDNQTVVLVSRGKNK